MKWFCSAVLVVFAAHLMAAPVVIPCDNYPGGYLKGEDRSGYLQAVLDFKAMFRMANVSAPDLNRCLYLDTYQSLKTAVIDSNAVVLLESSLEPYLEQMQYDDEPQVMLVMVDADSRRLYPRQVEGSGQMSVVTRNESTSDTTGLTGAETALITVFSTVFTGLLMIVSGGCTCWILQSCSNDYQAMTAEKYEYSYAIARQEADQTDAAVTFSCYQNWVAARPYLMFIPARLYIHGSSFLRYSKRKLHAGLMNVLALFIICYVRLTCQGHQVSV